MKLNLEIAEFPIGQKCCFSIKWNAFFLFVLVVMMIITVASALNPSMPISVRNPIIPEKYHEDSVWGKKILFSVTLSQYLLPLIHVHYI